MEDTLRYFFSSLFQGFAAIVTLGAMYFLYFFDKIESKKNQVLERLKVFEGMEGASGREYIIRNGIMKYLKEKYIPQHKADVSPYSFNINVLLFLVDKFDSLEAKENNIRALLPKLLTNAIKILITSIICLFLTGYNLYLNYFLTLIGIYLIVLSIQYLFLIKKTIIEISKD